MLINGQKVIRKNQISIRNPYTRKVVGKVSGLERRDILRAVDVASGYDFSIPAYRRSEILSTAARHLKKQKKEFAQLITKEIGICLKDSLHEVERAHHVVSLSAEEAKHIKGEVYAQEISGNTGPHLSIILREPVGLILCVTPFNHPLNQVVHKVCPAIAANNSVILKPSEKAPLTALKFAELMLAAGLPHQMLQVVTGHVNVIGPLLVQHPAIDMISFTGSTRTGQWIMRRCGIKKLSLELGGNDAFVVMPDADIPKAAEIAARGAFGNSGQRCSAIKRIITFPGNAQAFASALVQEVRKWSVGNPFDAKTDIGTVISEEAAKIIERRIQSAIRQGARLLIGGRRKGALVWPTVLDHVRINSELVSRETFGPVAPILRASSLEEAIRMVNATRYGLNASIMTNNLKWAMEFSRKVRVGGVRINQAPGFRNEYVAFGGNKMSGFGRSGVKYTVEEMTNLKTVILS